MWAVIRRSLSVMESTSSEYVVLLERLPSFIILHGCYEGHIIECTPEIRVVYSLGAFAFPGDDIEIRFRWAFDYTCLDCGLTGRTVLV
jgi:hypothetical protein